MSRSTNLVCFALCGLAVLVLIVPGCSDKQDGAAPSPSGSASSSTAAAPKAAAPEAAARRNVEESQALVLLRGLPTLGTAHSVAIVELNPEAANFGAILQDFELPNLT